MLPNPQPMFDDKGVPRCTSVCPFCRVMKKSKFVACKIGHGIGDGRGVLGAPCLPAIEQMAVQIDILKRCVADSADRIRELENDEGDWRIVQVVRVGSHEIDHPN